MSLPTLEELEARREAASLWLSENLRTAIVIPLAVWKDLLPNGGGEIEAARILTGILPGETVERVDRSTDSIYVVMK